MLSLTKTNTISFFSDHPSIFGPINILVKCLNSKQSTEDLSGLHTTKVEMTCQILGFCIASSQLHKIITQYPGDHAEGLDGITC